MLKKIECPEMRAPMIDGNGTLSYALWLNGSGEIHIEITGNSNSGRFDKDIAFAITDAIDGTMKGIDVRDFSKKEPANNNMPNFLKAVAIDLLPKSVN